MEEATREDFLAILWAIYALTGADTDGDDRFHCSDMSAMFSTVAAVRQLREDYDSALGEIGGVD